MSIRSANNKRTQNHEYTGAARKSASSAKPARAAASSVRVVPATSKERRRELQQGESLEGLSKEEKKARKQEMRLREDRMMSAANILMKRDDEYNKKRYIFWALVIVGMVVALAVWLLMSFSPTIGQSPVVQFGGIIIAYAAVIGGFIYDLVAIRPIRNYYKATVAGMTDRKVLDVLEESAKEDERKRAEKKAAKDEAPAEEAEAPRKSGPKKNHRSRH
ncbi:hypothetical protein [Enorma burkinafasonensis]|uniref:hypothetical protein n=1 Tax=Enorma burkinafasonensis TaxID=2590867 RepID=UPI0026EF57EF|nr:hypothetical protein [Enorma burkinafasonensis]MCI7731106.1 hypothetical protein [Enorma burkinafasonensis]